VHFIDDEQMPQERGGSEMGVPDHQRRQQDLVHRADHDATGQIALGILSRPRAIAEAIAIRPQHFEAGQASSLGFVYAVVAGHGKNNRWWRLERTLCCRQHAPMHLCGRRAGRESEVQAVDQASIKQ
jgi:hypothetical protein